MRPFNGEETVSHLRSRVAVFLGMLSLLASILLAGCTTAPIVEIPSVTAAASEPLRVGVSASPDGTNPQDGLLLANIYAQALGAAGVKAVVVPTDAADPTSLKKLQSGSVDVVAGYSRVFLSALGEDSDVIASSEVESTLKSSLKAPLKVLNMADAKDKDGLVVTAVTAQKYQLKSLADLAKVCGQLTFGGSINFQIAPSGLAALASDYKCVPKSYEQIPNTDNALVLALINDSVQVADLPSSSPAIEDNSLLVLDDPKGLFVDQSVVPLVDGKTVSADVQGVLNKVSAALSSAELVNLNRFSAANNFSTPEAAAHAWLVQIGLLKR